MRKERGKVAFEHLEVPEGRLFIGGEAVTATANEINTGTVEGLTADATELNKLDGVAAGTVSASKAVVVGTGKDVDTLDIIAPKINGVALSATAAELNKNAGITAGTVLASKVLVVDANKDLASLRDLTLRNLITTSGVGAKNGTGVTVVEHGDGAVHKTVLTFADQHVTLADNAGVVAYGGLKIYDFPEGFISFLGAVASLAITKSSAGVNVDWDGDFSLGSVTASNNNSLSSTEQDMIPTTPTPQAVAGASSATGVSTGTEAPKIFDGHTTALDAFLNFLVDDADHDVTGTACDLILNGTVTILWANLGDY